MRPITSRWNLTVLALASAIGLGPVAAAAGEMLIQLREENGQLRFFSNLVPGNHNIPELPVRGRSASAQILVEAGDGAERPVRQFRVESWQETSGESGQPSLRTGFAVELEPTSVADRFRLKLEVHRVREGAVEVHQAVLRRGFGMYYLSFTQPGAPSATVVGRAKSLVEMMLEFPQPYRAFEETAQQCSLPTVMFVPQSQFSPTVIEAVMGEAIDLPSPEAPPDWPRLVHELDSDDFSVRTKASDGLLAAGDEVVRFLRKLPPEELSLEQRARIAYVIRRLTAELPPQPQPLTPEAMQALQQAPAVEWLARLVLSSDSQVRGWALDRLHRQGLLGDLPADADADAAQRRELYDALSKQIAKP